jgi:hypothetical protein
MEPHAVFSERRAGGGSRYELKGRCSVVNREHA